ncbi:acyltransferase family protein [Aeromicrobium sp. UC242_57]|uniref:acyltransferase family protein n=1 Tax=Aeromicrobium sp. UC242_57 TaxID=3374624 RepID=UPI00379ACB7A
MLRAVGGWVGIGLIAYAVFFFDESTTWPGAHALVPTVGAALMIASGLTLTPGSPQRLLSIAPMVWIGGLSYSIYLWHWPILVAAQGDNPDLRIRWAVLLMVASIIPAWLCHKFIENPIRFGTGFKPTGRALGLGAALTALGVAVGMGLSASATIGSVKEGTSTGSVGAAALLDPANKDVVWSDIKKVDSIRPLPVNAPDDRPPFYDDKPECQVRNGDSEPFVCEFGDTSADRSVLIVGDSKMGQWETTFSTIGKREGFKPIQITKSACPFTDALIARGNEDDCRAFGIKAVQKILELKPDLVITSHRRNDALPEGKTGRENVTQDAMVDGMVKHWKKITGAGIPMVALLDNPDPGEDPVYECVAQNPDDLTKCAFDKADAIKRSGAPAALAAVKRMPEVKVMGLTQTLCPDDKLCAAVVGNVLINRQGSHVTRAYVDSAITRLEEALFEATDGKFGKK